MRAHTWQPTGFGLHCEQLEQRFFWVPNDGIVPLTSENNQQPIVFDQVFDVVHSQGVLDLGFTGPSVLESPQVLSDVMILLNASISSGGDFVSTKP